MKSNQQFSFERNRYYPGKMLTSADFQAEQTYFNGKRSFGNHMMFGSGVVCGLGVYSLDDLSFLVESGVALDGLGREIVIENAVVKKLSTLEGFEGIGSNRVSLCLRYKENKTSPAYSVNQSENGEEQEYNRVEESYELFLKDTEEVENVFEAENNFLSHGCLLNNGGYQIQLGMPSMVCMGNYVKCRLEITRTEETAGELSLFYDATLQLPAFTALDGTHELHIELRNISLAPGESINREYWIKAQNAESADTCVMLKSGSAKAAVNQKLVEPEKELSIRLSIADISPRRLVDEEIGKMSLETRMMKGISDYIRLADLSLVRNEATYIVEKITERNVKRYIETPAEEIRRNEYLEYFRTPDLIQAAQMEHLLVSPEREGLLAKGRSGPEIATGTLEIPVGGRVKKGEVYYSGEIMHGLGSGNVYVEIGYEYLEDDRAIGANIRSTVFGNPDLFKSSAARLSNVETAVKVLNDKGSFIVAARFLKDVEYLVLNFRWIAMRFQPNDEGKGLRDNAEKSITAKTPTIVLGTKESYYFDVSFHNMEKTSVGYEITEQGGGEITADGVYTAPNKEGVYEIRIYCLDAPLITTYAYAIVKKKAQEDGEDQK